MSSVNDCFVLFFKFSHHSKKGLHLGEKFQNLYSTNSTPKKTSKIDPSIGSRVLRIALSIK